MVLFVNGNKMIQNLGSIKIVQKIEKKNREAGKRYSF